MQLYYCAKCGLRLSNEEAGKIASEEEASNILCAACAPVPVAAVKASESAAAAGPAKRTTPHSPGTTLRPSTSRSRTELRTRTPGAGSGSSSSAGASARAVARAGQSGQAPATKSGSQPSTKSNGVIYGVGGAGAAALLLGIVLMTGSKSETKDRVAQTEQPKSEAPKTESIKKTEAPKSEKPPEAKSAEPPPRSAFAPVPVADPAFSPKEDYERRVRAGLVKPTNAPATTPEKPAVAEPAAEGAPASGPLPAYSAEDSNWHLLFNGKDFSGWHEAKGHFILEDGCIAHEINPSNAVVCTDVAYSDFDLNLKLMLVDGNRYAEVNVRNSSYLFGISGGDFNVWRDIRVSAHGRNVRATMDGVELPLVGATGTATSGDIGFYAPAGGHLKVKEIAIRTGGK